MLNRFVLKKIRINRNLYFFGSGKKCRTESEKGNPIQIQQGDDTLRLLEENSDGGVVRSDADVRVPGDSAGGAGPRY
jgi:hypothetical protein